MQIAINTNYHFEFDDRFSILNSIYFVERVLTYNDLVNEEIDLFEGLYALIGMSQPTYESELSRYINDVFYKLRDSNTHKVLWVPESIILGYPNPNVFEYSKVQLLTNLGTFDDPDTLLAIQNIIADTIKANLGSGHVKYLQLGVEPPTTITYDGDDYALQTDLLFNGKHFWIVATDTNKSIRWDIASNRWLVLNNGLLPANPIVIANTPDADGDTHIPRKDVGWTNSETIAYTTNTVGPLDNLKMYKTIEVVTTDIPDVGDPFYKDPVHKSVEDPSGISKSGNWYNKLISDNAGGFIRAIGTALTDNNLKAIHIAATEDPIPDPLLAGELSSIIFTQDITKVLTFANTTGATDYTVSYNTSELRWEVKDDVNVGNDKIFISDTKLGPYIDSVTPDSGEVISFVDASDTSDVIYWTKSTDIRNPVGTYVSPGNVFDPICVYEVHSIEQVEPLTTVSVYGTEWMTQDQYVEYASRRSRNTEVWLNPAIVDYFTKYTDVSRELVIANGRIEALEDKLFNP
jgi:hypothetical protein